MCRRRRKVTLALCRLQRSAGPQVGAREADAAWWWVMPASPDLFSRLTRRQIDALASVAFGGHGHGFSRRTLESLVGMDLLDQGDVVEGNFSYVAYDMPVAVHIAFCAWCETVAPEPTTAAQRG